MSKGLSRNKTKRFGSARQSQIEAAEGSDPNERDHYLKSKASEEDQFGKVTASQNALGYSLTTPKAVSVEKEIKKALGEQCACYVLITCTKPGPDGNMEVEMNYEGDETLAAFLLENASQAFDNPGNKRESR